MRPIIIALYAMLLSMFANSTALCNNSLDDKLMIVPDAFRVSERFHQPDFFIETISDGYRVKIGFAADASDINEYLYRQYGSSLVTKEIYEVELLPTKIHHLSALFEEKNIVKSWKNTFQLGEIHLEYYFTKDVTEEQIHNIFMFGFAFATVDVEVQCSGQITSKICDQKLLNIPLFNQFALNRGQSFRSDFEAYNNLSRYLSFIRLGKSYLNLSQLSHVDTYLKTLLYSGPSCKVGLDQEQNEICSLINTYSGSQSILGAIKNISTKMFGDNPVDSSRTFFIFDSPDFSLTNEPQIDVGHCSVFNAFCPIASGG